MSDKLLPCPFCGGAPRIQHVFMADPFCGGAPRIQHVFMADEPTHSRVICTNCHAKTDYYVYEFGDRNIIKVWNRRVDHD